MNILVAVIACAYKDYSLEACIEAIRIAGFDQILLNYEGELNRDYDIQYRQEWKCSGAGFVDRKYDQDQHARLPRIVIARNMCLDFAQSGGYDWILFVDSDVLIPGDTKEKLFTSEVPYKLRSGIVPGRGVHSHATYLFHPNKKKGVWQRADYFTCGFLAIHKDVFWRLRFRWGKGIRSSDICSEVPLFGEDARYILMENWWGWTDLQAAHVGDLKEGETSQF
jgi:hypothetical protein